MDDPGRVLVNDEDEPAPFRALGRLRLGRLCELALGCVFFESQVGQGRLPTDAKLLTL